MPRVAPVAQLDNLARTVTWSQYAHADFEFIITPGSDTPEGYRVQGGRLSLHVL